jgi:predicted RNase H-like HicB family nuclease
MAVTVKISREDGQWVADVPRAKGLVAWSASLERLRKHVQMALTQGYPALAGQELREVYMLPKGVQTLLDEAKKAERSAESAQKKASQLKRRASRELRERLGISVREVGALMGISGARAHQLLED